MDGTGHMIPIEKGGRGHVTAIGRSHDHQWRVVHMSLGTYTIMTLPLPPLLSPPLPSQDVQLLISQLLCPLAERESSTFFSSVSHVWLEWVSLSYKPDHNQTPQSGTMDHGPFLKTLCVVTYCRTWSPKCRHPRDWLRRRTPSLICCIGLR